MTVRTILSAVDFSKQSRQALRWAATFAAKFRRRLTVISVVDPLLAEAARIRLGLDPATAETEPALLGRAAHVIGSLAQEYQAQLIVIGLTSAQGPFRRVQDRSRIVY